ncbi:MAG: glutathione S-transferase [Sneathiella sp.]|nr:glutathione S-transferase [Sneathiella sp.]
MITVHHLNNSRSQRILWMLEELEIPYKIEFYQRDETTMLAPKELTRIHALGRSPVITDNDITIAESGAIIEYLTEVYGTEYQPNMGTSEYHQYRYWMHYAEGSLMPQLLVKLIFDKMKTNPMPFFVKPIAKKLANTVIEIFSRPNIDRNLEFVDDHLSKNNWFCGDQLSGADFQMSFPLEAVVARENGSNYPNILAFVDKIHSRPAYQNALKAGGPYHYA